MTLPEAIAWLAHRHCLAVPVLRADQRPWPEPPSVPWYLRESDVPMFLLEQAA